MSKFIIVSEFGETLDLALDLKRRGEDVMFHIPTKSYESIGKGLIEKCEHPFEYYGKNYVWTFDGCSAGRYQDWLREQGEAVFGGTEEGDEMENDRQKNQAWFKDAGFYQPISKNFHSVEDALVFVQAKPIRYILKQNGDAPKMINHMGKFDDASDMIFHLQGLQKTWNEQEWGKVDFDLMEVVEGLEIAASAWFNGQDYLRNEKGLVCGYLDAEEKKEGDGGTGETTGEMGTTFIGTDESNPIFKEILCKPAIIEKLRAMKYKGAFDINCIKTEKGLVALEPTMRFGIPSTPYEMEESLENPAEVIEACARGNQIVPKIHYGVGMVMVIAAKPFPIDSEALDKCDTSIGEKLWILRNGKPAKDFSPEQEKHIHLYNFEKKDKDYLVATKCGYLLTVTGVGKTIADTRKKLIQYIKDNIYISGMKYRTDIGARIEEYESELNTYKEESSSSLMPKKRELFVKK